MKIGVIADTHIPKRAKKLPDTLIEAFREVDYVIHAGDIASRDVLADLEAMAPLTAIAGNVDPEPLQKELGKRRIITLGGFRIGVVHGDGIKGKTVDRAFLAFEKDDVDCILFGHSHIPYCEYRGGVLLFNPGSPTDKRKNPYYSFGILELGSDIRANHYFFNKGSKVINNIVRS